jgi:phosphotransferase system HPr (HPr) family protein
VTFACGARAANAKSILDVLALGVRDGEELLVRAEGEGAEDAVGALARVLGEQRGRL